MEVAVAESVVDVFEGFFVVEVFLGDDCFELFHLFLVHEGLPVIIQVAGGSQGIDELIDEVFLATEHEAGVYGLVDLDDDFFVL